MQYVDFNHSIFVEEVFAISQMTRGGIGYSDCRDMDWQSYEVAVKRTIALQEEINRDIANADNG